MKVTLRLYVVIELSNGHFLQGISQLRFSSLLFVRPNIMKAFPADASAEMSV
jgi:hypothetical protein